MSEQAALWGSYCITDAGLSLRQKAIAEGLRLCFIRAEIGTGIPDKPEDTWSMTALVSSAREVPIKKSFEAQGTHRMIIHIDNLDFPEEVWMRELGVFACLTDENNRQVGETVLYGYSYTEHGYEIIPPGSAFRRLWDIGADTGISRSSTVEIVYNGDGIYLTPDDLDAHNADPIAHGGLLQQLVPSTPLIAITHNLGCYPRLLVLGNAHFGAGLGGAGEKPAGGTDLEELPTRAAWHDPSTLTVKTIPEIVALGIPELHQINAGEYTITFAGNDEISLYVYLDTGKGGSEPQESISIQNMVFSETPPQDKTVIWGELK